MAGEDRQNRRVLLGTLLIVALIATSVLIFMMDAIVDRFTRRYHVVAIVKDANGIVDGSAVWIGGKEVGVVSTVAFLPTGSDTIARIALTLELPRRLQAQVRKDSRVRIASARLIGARAVDIIPGSPGAAVLAAGDTLDQGDRMTVDKLTARAKAVRLGFDTVYAEMIALAPTARLRLQDTQRALAGLDRAAADVRQLRGDIAASPGAALLADTAFTGALDRARRHAAELPVVIARLRQRSQPVEGAAAGGAAGAVTGGIPGPAGVTGAGGETVTLADVTAALARLQVRADSLSAQLDAIAAMIGPNSSLSRLQQDSALAVALRTARMDLDSLIAEVRRNPLRFVF